MLAACYVGGPFLTLWRISRAIDTGDVAVLNSAIDWNAVREGLKDDLADGLIGYSPQMQLASNTLPPFGAGFATGIVGSEVDGAVTPETLRHAAHVLYPPSAGGFGMPAIVGANFHSLTGFDLRVLLPFQPADEQPLHLRMAFRDGRWQVVRIWVPQDLMEFAAARI
jgi:hypothetical protein